MGAILMRIKVESFSLPKHRFEPKYEELMRFQACELHESVIIQ